MARGPLFRTPRQDGQGEVVGGLEGVVGTGQKTYPVAERPRPRETFAFHQAPAPKPAGPEKLEQREAEVCEGREGLRAAA